MAVVLVFLGPEVETVLTNVKELDVLAVGRVGRVVPGLRAVGSELNEFNGFELGHGLVLLDLVLVHPEMLIVVEESLSLVLLSSSCTVGGVMSASCFPSGYCLLLLLFCFFG